MLRERLKEIDLRITELADYLQTSRPTMYKYIEYYDSSEFDQINRKVLKLFNYIAENELVGKKNVISYILNHLVDVTELGSNEDNASIKNIKKYIISNPDSKKAKFIELCSQSQVYDELIYYLVDIYPLLKKRKLSEKEAELLKPYFDIQNLTPKN